MKSAFLPKDFEDHSKTLMVEQNGIFLGRNNLGGSLVDQPCLLPWGTSEQKRVRPVDDHADEQRAQVLLLFPDRTTFQSWDSGIGGFHLPGSVFRMDVPLSISNTFVFSHYGWEENWQPENKESIPLKNLLANIWQARGAAQVRHLKK